jgi:peroxiredoxin
MDAIQTERKEKANQEWAEIINNASAGYIDIELNDKNNKQRKLSELEGKVVLIDFSSYEMKNSVQYTFELRDLYNKYSGRGFEIFQISLDRSKLLWEESVANLPWVCVRDANGPNTPVVSAYNVRAIPTIFLMNRQGDIIGRDLSFEELNAKIAKLL